MLAGAFPRVFSELMRALQLIEHGQPGRFEVTTLPDPQPGAEEVIVSVRACGLNHLDLWLEEGGLPTPVKLPRTPGGEIAGVIAAVGSAVRDWKTGDRVAVQSNLFCGECEFCREGHENRCLKGELLGVQRDGGFAEQVLVPARALVRIPEGVDFHTSAALTLAGSTAMHMLKQRATVRPGQWVLVMAGASGVGAAAIQIAKQLGAMVISTGRSPAKRDFATRLGADAVVDTNDANWPAQVRKLTDKRGVDLVVEHVGGNVFEQLFNCLARDGTIVTCGATAGRNVQMNLWPFFVKEQRLIGSYGRTRADMTETLRWADRGWLKATIDELISLDRGELAFHKLRAGAHLGKQLIVL
jgi:NADPH:quinone reductase-like Zn-dependent oxidoreductase